MSLSEYRFKITVIVEHKYKKYEEHRESDSEGCNHIDNISCVADYMGQKIREDIKAKRKL